MKQIFDWLRAQINELLKPDIECFECEEDFEFELKRHNKYIGLVNEAEAKWEADCCIRVIGKPFVSSCGQKYDKWTYVGEPYCAKCGKPIKISEVEQ